VLDAVLVADPAEDVSDEVAGPVALDELSTEPERLSLRINLRSCEHSVHLIGNGRLERLEEGGNRELRYRRP
jgi:hypothetical protein